MRAYLLGGRPLHFPFLSGILQYQCEGCHAPCCRATPLGIGRSRELKTLGKAQPSLPLFATPGFYGSPMLSLQSPRERCWFLDGKRKCRLESRVGRDAKPAGCRLFPFQRLRSMGKSLCVLPDFTCPLQVGDHVLNEGPFSHDELCLEMHRTKVPPKGHPALPAPADMAWEQASRLEGRVSRRAERFLHAPSYLDFAVKQDELTAKLLETQPRPERLARLENAIRSRMPTHARSAGAVHDTVAVSGVLRVMASSLPRADMPALLLATSIFLEVYDDMRGTRRSARTAISLFEQRLPLLFVFAHLRDRPALKRGADPKTMLTTLPAIRAPLLKALQAVVDNRHAKRPRSLLAILDGLGDVFAAPLSFEGTAMLYAFGRVLMVHGAFK